MANTAFELFEVVTNPDGHLNVTVDNKATVGIMKKVMDSKSPVYDKEWRSVLQRKVEEVLGRELSVEEVDDLKAKTK